MEAQITLVGRIAEPNLRFTPQGKAVLSFSLVTDRRFKDSNDEWQSADSTWWNCEVWEKAAVRLADVLQKGMPVIVIGTVHEQTWEKDGEERRRMVVRVRSAGPNVAEKELPGVVPVFTDEAPF